MANLPQVSLPAHQPERRPWDARLALWLVRPLQHSSVTPNHLTTVRLLVGLAACAAFMPGSYGWSNIGALLLVLSNFLDHTDGELARLSGKTSRIGHLYDLASDAFVTTALFIAIGVGVAAKSKLEIEVAPALLGAVAGLAISLIFFLRMRIEDALGKSATRQASFGGFETEDILYLMPLAALSNSLAPLLVLASIVAPLFAVWVVVDYRRIMRRDRQMSPEVAG
jgi:archaetidylinositol phosphate synthase